MAFYEHLTQFGGLTVVEWTPKQSLPDLETSMVRLALEYDDKQSWTELLTAYLAQPGAERTRGLVMGAFSGEMFDTPPDEAIGAMIAARDQLPRLEVLFLNDITCEENEISWIENTDNAPLIQAFPNLRHYGVRGGNRLRFKELKARHLTHLVVQSGGLNRETVQDLLQAELPELTHLELYLGAEEYGASVALDDLTPLLEGALFPKLNYLGLKNADLQDEIARALGASEVLHRLHTVDLSLGVLTDDGAQSLLNAPLGHLRHLNLSYHFLSNAMVSKLQAMAAQHGFSIDLSEQQEGEDDDYRFVSIGE